MNSCTPWWFDISMAGSIFQGRVQYNIGAWGRTMFLQPHQAPSLRLCVPSRVLATSYFSNVPSLQCALLL